ncbi:hypothetical protein K435DRAFT_861032 [Dendrothele bispora CBS 962.96]|uniref:Uncharacterized protein n=1 Tax=Dendrothele bispora (strain CBS 962.96) TaxID=1314807 RepID=A0A4S8LXR1_DENBC|nr:hypothetical protein K435DRAFT_861032 [Dendrothele bispora CBS 962.96]
MPRPKIHKTKEQRILANRLKSSKHYERYKDSINQKRRDQYQAQVKANSLTDSIERKKRQEAFRHIAVSQLFLDLHSINDLSRDPIVEIHRVQRSLDRATDYSPSSYLEKIYQKHQLWLRNDQVSSESPVTQAVSQFEDLFESSKPLTHNILQEFGYGSEYLEASRIQKRIRRIVECLEDLELARMEGTLDSLYQLHRLRFQDTATIHYIDGQ